MIDEAAAEGRSILAASRGRRGWSIWSTSGLPALKRRDVSAEDYRRGSRGAAPRLRELAELYGGTRSGWRLGDWSTRKDCSWRRGTGSPVAEIGTGLELVVVDGFTDFTSAQLGILRGAGGAGAAGGGDVGGRRGLNAEGGMLNAEGGAARREMFAKTQATRKRC